MSKIGKSHPHVAYCAYMHGLANKWTYFLQTISGIFDLLKPLEDAIFHHFIPALVGKPVSDVERALFALPVHLVAWEFPIFKHCLIQILLLLLGLPIH